MNGERIKWGALVLGAALVTGAAVACLFANPAAVAATGSALSGAFTTVGEWIASLTTSAGLHTTATAAVGGGLGVLAGGYAAKVTSQSAAADGVDLAR